MEQGHLSLEEVRALLGRAIPAAFTGTVSAIELFTDDVIGEGPHLHVRSRAELEHMLMDIAGMLSNARFAMDDLEEVAGGYIVTWRLTAEHTGEALLEEEELIEPTGRRIELSATTLVQFRGRRIRSFQTVYDSRPLFDQIREPPPRTA